MSSFTDQPPAPEHRRPQLNPYATPLAPLRPALGFATTGAWLLLAVQVVNTSWVFGSYRAVETVDLAGQTRFETVDLPLTFLIAVVHVIALIAGGRWLAAARRNADLLPPFHRQSLSPAWVWWSWLVPIVSWWFPRRVVLDIWTDPAPGTPNRALVNRWWGLFVTFLVFSGISSRLDVSTPGQGIAAVVFAVAGTVCLALALPAWLQILGRITADQDQAIGVPPPAPTGWSQAR